MKEENDRLMAMTEDEIFAEIGRTLLSDQFGAVRLSDTEAARAGRSWFQSVLPSIRERICGKPALEAHLTGNVAAARNAALLAILDTLLSGMFAGFPVATISHAVVIYGIHKVCEGAADAKAGED
jgi:hypothetical protein